MNDSLITSLLNIIIIDSMSLKYISIIFYVQYIYPLKGAANVLHTFAATFMRDANSSEQGQNTARLLIREHRVPSGLFF